MENSTYNFEERRKENLNVRDIIDDKIREVEYRRDKNLQQKVDAIEKLVNLTFLTKSEALGVAISRMQGDSKDCLSRCSSQVGKFYEVINKINGENVGRDIHINTVLNAIHEINKNIVELEKAYDTSVDSFVKANKDTIDTLELADKNKIESLLSKIDGLETWKRGFWVKNATVAIVTSVFISQILFQGFTWVVDYLSKVKPPVP